MTLALEVEQCARFSRVVTCTLLERLQPDWKRYAKRSVQWDAHAMYHTIAFTADLALDLERSPRHPLERALFRAGTCCSAQVKPYVAEDGARLVEVADLFFPDGTVTRRVPFACFSFLD